MTTLVFAATTAAASGTVTVAAGSTKAIHLVPATGQLLDPSAEAAIYYMNGTDPVFKGVCRADGIVIGAEGPYRIDKLPGANFGAVSEP